MRISVISWAAVIFTTGAVFGGQDTGPPAQGAVGENAAAAAAFAAAEAKRYEIHIAERPADLLELVPQPVLRWSNPTKGDVHGSVMLWKQNGCPQAAASINRFFDREQINVELVSLSENSLMGTRNRKVRWTPNAGVEFKKIPDAPKAADSPEQRQLQARSLARSFSGQLTERGQDGRMTELRLMSRPLMQYRATDQSDREGAVFAYVTTTDPEILLLIESRSTPMGREWVYAAARMHFCKVQLKRGDAVLWSVPQAAPPWDEIRGPKGDYVILQWSTPEAAESD